MVTRVHTTQAKMLAYALFAFALFVIALIPGAPTRPLVVPPPPAPVVEIPRDRSASLTVSVTADGRPVARARVKALFTTDEGAALAGEAATDDAGRAILGALPRGAFWLIAEADGRARGSTYVALFERSTQEVTIALAAGHVLEVRVRDESGAAIAGAEIEITAGSPLPVGGITDAQGTARIDRLGSGPYAVTARAAGREEVAKSGVPEEKPYEVVLRKLGAVRVEVVDGSGKKVAGARVEIAGATLGTARSGETGPAGDVRIGGLPEGGYALRAVHAQLVSPTELDVRLRPGEEKSVSLRLEPGIMVGVRVLSEESRNDEPIAGASVILAENGLTPFPLESITERDGRTRLGPILRGPATISVAARGFVTRGGIPVTPFPPQGGPENAAEVRVVLARAGTIEGRVVDGRGFAIGGVSLIVTGTDPSGAPIDEDPRRARFRDALFAAALPGPAALIPHGELGVVPGPVPSIPRAAPTWVPPTPAPRNEPPTEPWTTRDDGTFRLHPVSPGRVRVLARHAQYVEAGSETVSLAPGGRAEVTIVLREGAVVEGTVVDAKGRPESAARVTVLATHGFLERSLKTGDDGRFAFASLPDSVTILVEGSGQRNARIGLELKEGERREVRIVLPEPREAIDVRVRDDRDYPVDAVELSVGSLDPSAPLRTTVFTDARGEARILGARGLPLRIVASHPRHATKSVTLENAGASLALVIVRGESISGEVRGRRIGAIAGAEVVAIAGADGLRSRTVTNTRGEFKLDGLPLERVRLVVRARGHSPAEQSVTVERTRADRGVDVGRIELAEESVVEGEVVDESGKPIAGARIGRDHAPTWIPTGALPPGLTLSDARGAFRLGELPEGTVNLEAFAADLGRGSVENVRVSPGRPTSGVRIVITREASRGKEPNASGNVAVTLGVTEDGAVVVSSVVEGSAAERAGLTEGDRLLKVDGSAVHTMDDARAKLAGPVQDDVVIGLKRGERTLTLRVPREASRR